MWVDFYRLTGINHGSQFTSEAYTAILQSRDIQISMDSRGRCFDNVFCERLWRSVKYEDIYLKSYRTLVEEAYTSSVSEGCKLRRE